MCRRRTPDSGCTGWARLSFPLNCSVCAFRGIDRVGCALCARRQGFAPLLEAHAGCRVVVVPPGDLLSAWQPSEVVAVRNVEYLPLDGALSDRAPLISGLELRNHGFVVSHPKLDATSHQPVVREALAREMTGILKQHQLGRIPMNTPRARKRPRLNFDEMGIPTDSILKSMAGNMTVQVTGAHTVRVGATEMTLTEATRKVRGPNFSSNPCPQWTFKGKSVGKIYDATYGPR